MRRNKWNEEQVDTFMCVCVWSLCRAGRGTCALVIMEIAFGKFDDAVMANTY